MRALYVGSDLHSNNNLLAVLTKKEEGFKKKVLNDPQMVRDVLEPFKEEIVALQLNRRITGIGW